MGLLTQKNGSKRPKKRPVKRLMGTPIPNLTFWKVNLKKWGVMESKRMKDGPKVIDDPINVRKR